MDLQEQVEWEDVNKLLQHHGFKPIHFADPVENKNLSDLVLLDKKSAGDIRKTLRTMLTDSERRQALTKELIKSNNQLIPKLNILQLGALLDGVKTRVQDLEDHCLGKAAQQHSHTQQLQKEKQEALVGEQMLTMKVERINGEEAQEHMSRVAHHSQRATELEALLDGVKTRVQDLEDHCLGKAAQQHSHTQQLQKEKQEALLRCSVLEEKLSKQREEAAQLQKKLYFTIKEEERRQARQSQAFQDICSRVSQQNCPQDQQVSDVIDFYETKMSQLLDELRSIKRHLEQSQAGHEMKLKNTTPSSKAILMAYQDQQKECKGQINELKTELEQLKQKLEARLTLKEMNFYKHKLHRLGGLYRHNNARLPQEDDSTQITGDISDPTRETSLCVHYQQLLDEISTIVTSPHAPLGLHKRKPPSVSWQEADFQILLLTLEVWSRQLHLLKDLQKGLNKLSGRLMPWQPPNEDPGALKVEDMMLLVDTLLENTQTDDAKMLRSPTRYTLSSMVSHFQKLFDVTSLRGVYPRMNEVYTRLGEMTNTMRNLRDVLELDSRVSPAEVFNHVARLVSSTEHSAGLHSLLGEADINSLIIKVKQHEEFFTAFHALILDILQTLGVSRLDDILPTLKSLKQMVH